MSVFPVVEEHFPGLGRAVAVALSVPATVLLKDNVNPVAVKFVDGPSSSKTTVLDMLDGHPSTYRSDNFSPAAFVSHASTVKASDLGKIDLLPKIRHKTFLTPEMAPIFRGKTDDLQARFSIITRVLDGRGLMSDSGTHGQRGYSGDYMFAWLGATTPLPQIVWDVMGQLGSRLLFFRMDPTKIVSDDELLALIDGGKGLPYAQRLEACRAVVQPFLTELLKPGPRGVTWPGQDPKEVLAWLPRIARMVARFRTVPAHVKDYGPAEYVEAQRELPYRLQSVLFNLIRGYALVQGRTHLDVADLPLMIRVAVDSMPGVYGRVFTALVEKGQPVTVAELRHVLGLASEEPVRRLMSDLDWRGVMVYDHKGAGKPATLRFADDPDLAWCAEPTFRDLLRKGGCKAGLPSPQPEPATQGGL